jgi:hypothetical protein
MLSSFQVTIHTRSICSVHVVPCTGLSCRHAHKSSRIQNVCHAASLKVAAII